VGVVVEYFLLLWGYGRRGDHGGAEMCSQLRAHGAVPAAGVQDLAARLRWPNGNSSIALLAGAFLFTITILEMSEN
jgi:hypothetical protein